MTKATKPPELPEWKTDNCWCGGPWPDCGSESIAMCAANYWAGRAHFLPGVQNQHSWRFPKPRHVIAVKATLVPKPPPKLLAADVDEGESDEEA